jgi:hypothetical protein
VNGQVRALKSETARRRSDGSVSQILAIAGTGMKTSDPLLAKQNCSEMSDLGLSHDRPARRPAGSRCTGVSWFKTGPLLAIANTVASHASMGVQPAQIPLLVGQITFLKTGTRCV